MKKPQFFYFQDHIMLLTEQEPQEMHRHLATQLVIALDAKMDFVIGGEQVVCNGVYIDGNVEHVCEGRGRFITLLFFKTSDYACTAERRLLKGRAYEVLEYGIVEKVKAAFLEAEGDPEIIDKNVLELCKITKEEKRVYDERIAQAIKMVEAQETVTADMLDRMSRLTCLSKSRFSHLFKEETGMSLASYLAFEKLRKTCKYMMSGKNITDSCLMAGFDSPSHCAASCSKMFGISLKKIAFN